MEDDAIPRRWRLAGIASAVIGFLLVSAAIHVSTYDVRFGTRVWAQDTMEAGGSAAVRVAIMGRQGAGSVTGSTARLSLVPAKEAAHAMPAAKREASPAGVHLGELESADTGLIEDSLHLPPDLPPGRYVLLVAVSTPAGPDELAALPVTVVPEGAAPREGWAVVRAACEESSSKRPDGGWHPARRCVREPPPVHLYPIGGSLVAHVRGQVQVWVAPNEGRPPDSVETAEEPGSVEAVEEPGSVEAVEEPDSVETAAEALETEVDLRPLSVDGRPLPGRLEVVPLSPVSAGAEPGPAGPKKLVPLDSLGLGSFEYAPGFPRGSLLVRGGGRDEIEERIWLRDMPAPLVLEAGERLLEPGDTFDVRVVARQPNRKVLLEVWNDGRWISAHSGHVRGERERLGIPLPDDLRGLVMVRGGLGIGGSANAHTFAWVGEGVGGAAAGALARALESLPVAEPLADYASGPPPFEPLIAWMAGLDDAHLDELGSGEARRAASAMLSRVEPATRAPPLLGDTTGEKMLALDAWKEGLRRPILVGLILVAVATLVSVGWLIVSYQRRVTRRLAALELDEGDDADSEQSGAMTNGGWLAPALVLGVVFCAAVAGLLIFLETLRWNRGDVFAARQRDAASAVEATEPESD